MATMYMVCFDLDVCFSCNLIDADTHDMALAYANHYAAVHGYPAVTKVHAQTDAEAQANILKGMPVHSLLTVREWYENATEAQPTEAQPTEAQPTEAQPTEAQPTLHDVGEAIRNYCQKAGMTEKQLAHVDAAILAVHVAFAAGMLADCVHVSRGNRKIGRLFNFSLLPGFTCGHWASVSCLHGGCYALKENRYPAVLFNRVQNTIMAICFPDILR